ncbi:putative E3 ubiquitin-protein ligase RING1a [Papaver somniferum]|uniref:putative E3 ubiquitin-protein ligase RING1a n=1 Tax=Papaver somniferum TaxID=3469 RepID=UPI000E6F9FBD|nr:putative E3 ubiquitin-protein ligase RING1a [Papaver somniferum]
MSVQKRSPENLMEDSYHHHQQQQERYDCYQKQQTLQQNEEQIQDRVGDDDSDPTPSSSSGDDKDDFVLVKLSEIRKEVQCPICLGIIRKTRTVMECLHRFCRECIDKSIRLGNNECPACRTHCASRRSLRDDPNYDILIATLYPDIDEYEEKELAFGDEEKIRNNHIQDYIAQTVRRQSSALGSTHKSRTTAKSVTSFTRTTDQPNKRRGRRRNNELTQSSEDDDHVNGTGSSNGNGYVNCNRVDGRSSSSDDSSMDVKPRTRRRWVRCCFSQPSSASANANTEFNENNGSEDVTKGSADPFKTPGFVRVPEVLVWGKGGTRSHSRQRNLTAGNSMNSRIPRSNPLFDLVDNIHKLEEDNPEA